MTKIIDNFLDVDYFNKIKELVFGDNFSWYYNAQVNNDQSKDSLNFYMTHLVFAEKPNSEHFDFFKPLFDKIGVKQLIRVKINLYPRSETLSVNAPHVDFDYTHKGFILYLNTCDGYTVLKDRKVESIENRALFFDSSVPHSSTTCTNATARFNMNINYI